MSEKDVTPRAADEINGEYARLCGEAGQMRYQATKLDEARTELLGKIDAIHKRIDELTKEMEAVSGSKTPQ